jgi:hypothetical protein
MGYSVEEQPKTRERSEATLEIDNLKKKHNTATFSLGKVRKNLTVPLLGLGFGDHLNKCLHDYQEFENKLRDEVNIKLRELAKVSQLCVDVVQIMSLHALHIGWGCFSI